MGSSKLIVNRFNPIMVRQAHHERIKSAFPYITAAADIKIPLINHLIIPSRQQPKSLLPNNNGLIIGGRLYFAFPNFFIYPYRFTFDHVSALSSMLTC